MNNTLFNSIEEISIRILIQLYVLDDIKKTADFISYLDYLTIYSKTFGFGEFDLHGTNPYRLSELSARLDLGKKALLSLVAKGFCNVENEKEGLLYSITDTGYKIVKEMKSNYAMKYIELACDTIEYFKHYSEKDINKYIIDRTYILGGE